MKSPRQVRTWLFKIDDERNSRGHAYIDLLKMHQVGAMVEMAAKKHKLSIG